MKCMHFILKYFEQNCKVRNRNMRSASKASTSEASESEIGQPSSSTSQEKIFIHCFIQGVALILATKHEVIFRNEPEVFN